MVTVLKYKSVDVSRVNIEKPIKINGYYTSKVSYDNNDMFIQTPVVQLIDTQHVKFNLARRGQLFTCLDDLHHRFADLLYTHSKEFFNKTFSETRIQDSLCKIVNITDSVVTFTDNVISYQDNIKVYNSFKESVDFSDSLFPINAIIIIHIDSLIFKGKHIEPVIKITHVKIDYNSNKKKNYECILSESETDSETGVAVEETGVAVEETGVAVEETGVAVEETGDNWGKYGSNGSDSDTEEHVLDELDVVVDNFDSENYFDDEENQ
jgi:hypothetical protein